MLRRVIIPALVLLAACGSRGSSAPLELDGAKLRITGPYAHENLAVYLIHTDRQDDRDFVTLDEALKNGWVTVTEKQQEQVNELLLENKGDKPVFIQEGDRVIGGKQDRIIGMSFVVPPKSGGMAVPSFCVESGRWVQGQTGANFYAGSNSTLATKEVREAAKVGKNQSEVWEQVAKAKGAAQTTLGTLNSNSSLNETLEDPKVKQLCDTYAAALKGVADRHGDAVGVAIVLNGKIEEVNVYPGHALLAKLLPRVVQSYALTAATNKKPGTPPAAAEIAKFMQERDVKQQRTEKVAGNNELQVQDFVTQVQCQTRYEGKMVHCQWMMKSDASSVEPRQRNVIEPQQRQQNEEPQRQRDD